MTQMSDLRRGVSVMVSVSRLPRLESSEPTGPTRVAQRPRVPSLSVTGIDNEHSSCTAVWQPGFEPPASPEIDKKQLVRLSPAVVELDFAALMGSRVRLREELHWVRGWPRDDFTLEENRKDLERHDREFSRGEAYAYSVLDTGSSTCIGCIYIGPWQQAVKLSFWVVDAEVERGLETRLLKRVLEWLGAQWNVARVLVPLRAENTRCIELARKLGLRRIDEGGIDDHVNLLWTRENTCSERPL